MYCNDDGSDDSEDKSAYILWRLYCIRLMAVYIQAYAILRTRSDVALGSNNKQNVDNLSSLSLIDV